MGVERTFYMRGCRVVSTLDDAEVRDALAGVKDKAAGDLLRLVRQRRALSPAQQALAHKLVAPLFPGRVSLVYGPRVGVAGPQASSNPYAGLQPAVPITSRPRPLAGPSVLSLPGTPRPEPRPYAPEADALEDALLALAGGKPVKHAGLEEAEEVIYVDANEGDEADSPAVDMPSVYLLFDRARMAKIAFPKIRFKVGGEDVVLAVAGEKSKHPGSIHVTDGRRYPNNVYYGRITTEGFFEPYRSCTPAVAAFVAEFAKDPVAVSLKYGQDSGVCCFCGDRLKRPKLGYGPTCAKNWGLPWSAKAASGEVPDVRAQLRGCGAQRSNATDNQADLLETPTEADF